MKVLLFLALVSTSVFAQDASQSLKNFDAKIYSLKTKGISNFIVDIESPNLLKQVNQQQSFGKVKELTFRLYWTANPERMAVEVLGLPEGFKEVKEELKASILPAVESLLPLPVAQGYPGYKFSQGKNPKEIIAQDSTGLAAIPSFVIKFDEQDKLVESVANKPIGSMSTKFNYGKESFSDGKWVLKDQTTTATENGGSMVIKKELSYDKVNGVGVLSEVEVTSEQKAADPKIKPVVKSDTMEFKNYKINDGEALKYFLSEGNSAPVKK